MVALRPLAASVALALVLVSACKKKEKGDEGAFFKSDKPADMGPPAESDVGMAGSAAAGSAEAAEATPPSPRFSWTIMVYLDADNSLDAASIDDFEEMALLDYPENIKVVLEYDRRGIVGSSDEGDWTQTLRFEMKQGLRPLPSDALEDLGEMNMGDPDTLSGFVDWAKTKYPAQHYAVVIWNHGQGWRALVNAKFKILQAANKQLKNNDFIKSKNAEVLSHELVEQKPVLQEALPVTFRSIASDDTDDDTLFNHEIAAALSNKHIDVLGFDACLMSMIETAYALRDTAPYLVASEELEPGEGWRYNDWLGRVIASPDVGPEDFAKAIVASYEQIGGAATTLSATDTRKAVELAKAVSTLGDALSSELPTKFNQIVVARKACREYAAGHHYTDGTPQFPYVDVEQLCTQLRKQLKDEISVTGACDEVSKKLKEAVLANFAGASRRFSNGLSIYFPRDLHGYQMDGFEQGGYEKDNTFEPVDFVTQMHWADFLHTYFEKFK